MHRSIDAREQLMEDASTELEGGSNDATSTRCDAGQPFETAPEQQSQGDRLRLIVRVVGGDDPPRADPIGFTLEKRVALVPRPGLDARRGGRTVRGLKTTDQSQGLGDLERPLGATSRVRIEPMVDVQRPQIEIQIEQCEGKRRRVGAAGEGEKQAIARADAEASQGAANRVDRRRGGQEDGGGEGT
ncbi:MAG: hypothetical protein AAGN46_07600 [Acidobacteriota bacterium]